MCWWAFSSLKSLPILCNRSSSSSLCQCKTVLSNYIKSKQNWKSAETDPTFTPHLQSSCKALLTCNDRQSRPLQTNYSTAKDMLHLAVKISSHADTETPAAQPGPVCLHQSSHQQQFPAKQEHCELKARGYKITALKCRTLETCFPGLVRKKKKSTPGYTFIFNVHLQSSGMCVNMGDDPPTLWCGLLLKLWVKQATTLISTLTGDS